MIDTLSDARVNIIICTRNRCESLRVTLTSIMSCQFPDYYDVNLIIVDNGSTDQTPQIVKNFTSARIPVRYICEKRPGQCFARNTGVEASNGDYILFTDDDIRVTPDWVVAMVGPLLRGEADGVTGSVVMANHLRRDWMQREHFLWLACNEGEGLEQPSPDFLGASMGFTRRAFELAGPFDTQLGPGPGTGGDDTLFSWRMKGLGLKIIRIDRPYIEHHFDPIRLLRSDLIRTAKKSGRNDAYLEYHWLHCEPMNLRHALLRAWLRLWYYRLRLCNEWKPWSKEGVTVWEKGMIQRISTIRNLMKIAGTNRRYTSTADSEHK